MKEDDANIPEWAREYPPADITPAEFEEWVGGLLAVVESDLEDLRVTLHDRVEGVEGTYEFDATIRYRWAGFEFLVIVEAKRHTNSIKRELVQVLHSKIQSVGAHKGVMISTSPFQSGAMEYAKVHGIALVSLTEGRFTFETKAVTAPPALSREEAKERFGIPTFVGHSFAPSDSPGSTVTLISPEHPEYIKKLLLAVPSASD